MFTKIFQLTLALTGVISLAGPSSASHDVDWSPVMGEARALDRAAQNLCRVVDRTRDAGVSRISARLTESVCALVEVLAHDECIEEVRAAQTEAQLWFDRLAASIEAHWTLRDDGRVRSAMERFVSHFNHLDEKINHRMLPAPIVHRNPIMGQHIPPAFGQPIPPFYGRPEPIYRILPYPYPIQSPIFAPYPIPIPRPNPQPIPRNPMTIPLAQSPGDWHQSNVPGYVSPGSWHYTNSNR